MNMKEHSRQRGEMFSVDKGIYQIHKELNGALHDFDENRNAEAQNTENVKELKARIQNLSRQMNMDIPSQVQINDRELTVPREVAEAVFDSMPLSSEQKKSHLVELDVSDLIVGATVGILAVAIDILLVGTPEVVKLFHGGERFDGSILTKTLRNVTSNNALFQSICEYLSKKCTVPFDISAQKGVVNPNNHRLRSLSHDPFLGIFFAITDILMETTTCIDNSGKLVILPNRKKFPQEQKLFSILYYWGHLISDLFTARGIPIPGFFLTQFFTTGTVDNSISKLSESMYRDGYDLRHLTSMAIPVAVKKILLYFYQKAKEPLLSPMLPLAERERREVEQNIKFVEIDFIAAAVASGGNVAKIFLPPNCGNLCALNLPEWWDLICGALRMKKIAQRDNTAEIIMDNREQINTMWENLVIPE